MRNINVHAHTFDMVYCKLVSVRYSACTIFIVSTCKLKKTVRLLIVFVAAVVVLCWLLRVLRGMIAMSPIQESGGFLGRRSDWWRFQRCWRTLSNTFTQLARYEILYQISFYSYRRPLTTRSIYSVYNINFELSQLNQSCGVMCCDVCVCACAFVCGYSYFSTNSVTRDIHL